MTLRPYSADLQKVFRDTLKTPGAPEVIDDGDPVTPVAIVAGTFALTSKTAVPLYGTRHASATSTTLGTVPSGKVWRVVGAWVNVVFGAAANDAGGYIQGGGTTLVYAGAGGLATQKGMNQQAQNWSVEACPVLTAGQTITLTSESAILNLCAGGATYVEYDA